MFNTSSNSDEGSFVSETCHVEGDMSTTGNLTIAGIIDGNIVSQRLVILDYPSGFVLRLTSVAVPQIKFLLVDFVFH